MRTLMPLGAALLLVSPVIADEGSRTIKVQFTKGASAKVIKGSLRGYESVNYTVSARAGQTMTVRLTTANGSNYFNVTEPGKDEALFNGSVAGNKFGGTLPSTGTYTVQVYLMRNAARRGETAAYTLTIAVR
ncbi:hypothetical protein KZ820_17960 [Sphingomonas sp. RRHST34]|uniref:DNA breaking-rejoining protein n=1 Tax=Sphingomonas citri TaxID=2862499 RepID=A0ABS7BSS6_9SPHN|nr:hypothetical protein [Sphingomonas citri]MBW6532631.1 hypothetical protein [Sphingomonas citri]